MKPFSLEELPHRRKITFCRKVLVKPIAHHADIKRRGGEWETLRESLDREDEYFLFLNDEEPEDGDDVGMSGQQSTAQEDTKDESEVDIKPEEQLEVEKKIYDDRQEDNKTVETPPYNASANNSGGEMVENRLKPRHIIEDRMEIVQHTGEMVVGVHMCKFVSGSTEGYGAQWPTKPEETQRAEFGVFQSCRILSNSEKDEKANFFDQEEEDERLFDAGDLKAAATGDPENMVANRAVTVESLAVINDEPLTDTAQLEEGIYEQFEPLLNGRNKDSSLFLTGNWQMADGNDDLDEMLVVANPALTLEGLALSSIQESTPDTQVEEKIADQKHTKPLPPLVPGIQERKRRNPFDCSGSTVNHDQSRIPFWVIKRRKIYPDMLRN
ncbi:hypothetical protein BGX38DRAFT_1273139 [Terfezia claveryi]|nr:hypothetical protein BGX38DRAFT_1273139 [Terfezia claveryi]